MASAIRRFDAVGGEGTAQGIFLTVDNPADAALPEIVAQIEACSGFYFVGGQQRRIVEVFRPGEGDSPAFQALVRRHLDGAVVSGSSAGAAIMTDPMINGGSSLGALSAGVRPEDGEEGVILHRGLGLWDGAFVDQHFLARGRWARLLVAILATDGLDLGMGIDENTAIVVDGDSVWVAGASGVVFFDTRNVVLDEAGHAGSGIGLYLLGPGDRVDMGSGAIQVDDSKQPLAGSASVEAIDDVLAELATSEDGIFERWALLRFLAAAGASDASQFTFAQDGYSFAFQKARGFQTVSWNEEGVEGLPAGLSVGPFTLSVAAN
jgi:cyanophycinase